MQRIEEQENGGKWRKRSEMGLLLQRGKKTRRKKKAKRLRLKEMKKRKREKTRNNSN